MRLDRRNVVLSMIVSTVGLAGHAPQAQAAPQQATSDNPLMHVDVPVNFDTGEVRNHGKQRDVAYSGIVRARGHSWIRLAFAEASLGRTPRGGEPTMLRITSLLDGGVQTMNARHLQEWGDSTAYFNGDAVRIEIICDPGAPPSRLRMDHFMAGPNVPMDEGGIATICGPTDDRVLSSEPNNARLLPSGCTAWIINDYNRTFLTAGHCGTSGSSVIQFNVPLSTSTGGLVNPPPQHQYAVDAVSVQSNNGGLGNDYCYFGCFPNSNTGLTPFQAQGAFYTLASAAPALASPAQSIRITGYGTVAAPVSLTWNQVQKTHAAPYSGVSGTVVSYLTDTTGGNSGSPIVNLANDTAIGIHTNGGCTSTGGTNTGTAINAAGLQTALANPRGVCIPDPPIDFTYPDGLPATVDPQGDSIRVQVINGNGGSPQPGSGQVFVDVGGGFAAAAMSEISPNVYDAIIPPSTCGSTVRFYFAAQSTAAATVTDPNNAPSTSYSALSAANVTESFSDSFQTDTGWTVTDSAGLTTGAWQRGVPVGGGDRQDPATDADGSGQCYVTGNTDGDFDVDGGSTTLTSPLLDASAPDASLVYWRWFVSTGTDDTILVQVSSNNGGNWVTLETATGTPQAWVRKEWRIDQIAGITPSAQFRVRFTAADNGTAHVVEGGIDGVKIRVIDCGADCVGDINGSNSVDVADLLQVITDWGACGNPGNCPSDITGDGQVNVADLLSVISHWGSCP